MTADPAAAGTREPAVLRALAAFAADWRVEDAPADALHHARRVLLDTIGVMLAGSGAPEIGALAARLGGPSGPCTLPGQRNRGSVLGAAIFDGTAGTWLDFDSAHRHPPGTPLLPAGHPPIHALAAALPVAESLGASGADLLAALVVGYDVGARIGVACRVRPEIHPHGTFPTLCAGVAAARLLGADSAQMASTIRLAAGLTLLPSFQTAYQGRTVRNTFAGIGSASGVLAANLARQGFTGEREPITSIFGHVSSDWLDLGLAVEQLGQRFAITEGYVKPYPCCRYVHPSIEATEQLRSGTAVDPAQIVSVEVATYRLAAELDNREPQSELAAKFSIPYVVASALVRGTVTQADFSESAIAEPLVRRVASRVSVREDPALTAMTPGRRPARVSVRTADGAMAYAEVERSSGGPDAPWSDAQVQAKFLGLASPVIGPERAAAVVTMVDRLPDGPAAPELLALLARNG